MRAIRMPRSSQRKFIPEPTRVQVIERNVKLAEIGKMIKGL
jgi:hypothetical protein